MEVPKEIKQTIKEIENQGQKLKVLTAKLHNWLSENKIDADTMNNTWLALELSNLMVDSVGGEELIRTLEEGSKDGENFKLLEEE